LLRDDILHSLHLNLSDSRSESADASIFIFRSVAGHRERKLGADYECHCAGAWADGTMRDLAPCCICGTSERKIRYSATAGVRRLFSTFDPYSGHYQINICNGCGLTYSSPILDEGDVRALYTNCSEANVANEEVDNVRATMKGYYDLGRSFLLRKKRALDVGCDVGLLLDVMQQDGFEELYSLEPVEVARKKALERVPAAAISGAFYQDTAFEKDSFDIITLIHVVDHLICPNEILDRALGDLRPGGVCIAVVHDIESPLAKLTGERFPAFNYFHHYFFSKSTLRALFAARGFEVLRVGPTWNRYSLPFFTEHVPVLPVSWRKGLSGFLRWLGLGQISMSLPVGNIGIVARKPLRAGGR
jgi:2-polyprenyl-3-methyl-5-hydroxy-6-metoxy-1,4-benzoquinol methylase